MSDHGTRRAPPGWYAESGRRSGRYRYWDGQNWSGDSVGARSSSLRSDGRSLSGQHQLAVALLGASVALITASLLLPWAESADGDRGVFDSSLSWLVGPGSVADSWLLVLAGVAVCWSLLITAVVNDYARAQVIAVGAGLVVMAFCVFEGLAIDDDLSSMGHKIGKGLFMAYGGGAAGALGGVLLKARL